MKTPNRRSLLRGFAATALVVTGLLIGLAASSDPRVEADGPATLMLPASAHAAAGPNVSYADIAAAVMPGVVNISTDKVMEMPSGHPMLEDPFFRRFFGDPEQEQGEQIQRSLGSGVIISADGYILTSNHVIERASKIRVLMGDGVELEAEIVGQDAPTDVAIIKVETKEKLPFVTFGSSGALRIGDQVMAIGNPFGVGQTVTLGIVSALGRSIGLAQYEDFIQTDASINPGNSGGALVNMDGQLVGINTAMLSRSGGSQGIGFAIPSDMIQSIKGMLIDGGEVKRAWLGVITAEVDQTMAAALGMDKPRGVLMATVNDDTPAQKAGLQENDVVLSVDGEPVNSISDLRNTISLAGVGHKARLEILRDGKHREVTVELAELPANIASNSPGARDDDMSEDGIAGVTVRNLSENLRTRMNLSADVEGVVVTDVSRSSDAFNRGLRQGDVILEVARGAVRDLDDFRERLKIDDDRPVLLKILRGEVTQLLAIPR